LEKAIDTGMRIKRGLIILISFYQRMKERNKSGNDFVYKNI
jgi:hypothetical protein